MKVYKTPEHIRARTKANYEANPAYFRDRFLWHKYGITLPQYEAMFESQGGVCAICAGVNDNGKRLSVDHNHTTGAVRALLCNACNTAIGHLKENVERVRAVAEYLIRFDLSTTGNISLQNP